MSPRDITAVLVTRGGYDISDVIESLKDFGEILIWDNSKRENLAVFGRYALIDLGIRKNVVFTMDDDCIVNAAALCAAYEPGVVTVNWSAKHREVNANLYRDGIAPLGWGSVFDARLVGVLDGWERDELFLRECDRVFTALNRVKVIDVPYRNLERADTGMWREKRHLDDFAAIRERIRKVKRKAA